MQAISGDEGGTIMMWNIQTGAREAHFANIVQAPNKCVASTCRPASHQLLLFCSLHACKGWLWLELVGYISKAGRWLQVSAKAAVTTLQQAW